MAQNWELIGQGIGSFFLILASAYALVRGHKKSDGKPPPERPPSRDDIKAMFEELRARMDKQYGMAADDRHDAGRQLDRIERGIERLCDRMDRIEKRR